MITLRKLARAIETRLGGTSAEALAEARTILSYFGFRSVIIDRGGFSSVALPIVALTAFSAGFAIIAALRFGVEEAKLSWA